MKLFKKKIKQFLYILINIWVFVYLKIYKILNYRKDKIFVYTDSRGFEISKIYNRKTPFSSYLLFLVKNYNCDLYICPEKHTTIFDFLFQLQKNNNKKFKHVISHIGVVDFSPRPISTINSILNLKRDKIQTCFSPAFFNKIYNLKVYPEEYLGEKTSSIVPSELIPDIAKAFNRIDNLIWITCNPVDINWRGNYKNDRPLNINMVYTKSILMIKELNEKIKIIDLTKFSIEEIHKYTCDNIHLSWDGMVLIEKKLKKILKND